MTLSVGDLIATLSIVVKMFFLVLQSNILNVIILSVVMLIVLAPSNSKGLVGEAVYNMREPKSSLS